MRSEEVFFLIIVAKRPDCKNSKITQHKGNFYVDQCDTNLRKESGILECFDPGMRHSGITVDE